MQLSGYKWIFYIKCIWLIINNSCPNNFFKISWILIANLNFYGTIFHSWIFMNKTTLITNLSLASFRWYHTILFKLMIDSLKIFLIILIILNGWIIHWISNFFIDIVLLWLNLIPLIVQIICIFFNLHFRCLLAILVLFWGFDVRRLRFYLNPWNKACQSTLAIIFSKSLHLFIVNIAWFNEFLVGCRVTVIVRYNLIVYMRFFG